MAKFAIMIKSLTEELNSIVEELEISNDDTDRREILLFKSGVIIEEIKTLIRGNQVVKVDTENKCYVLYPDGSKKY